MKADYEIPISAADIQKILPHRYPFLMVDRITEFLEGEEIRGHKNVASNEPFFTGHFPNRPVMPGVMMLEALAQIGAIYAKLCDDGVSMEGLMVFSGCEKVRFRRLVLPGDRLDLSMKFIAKKGPHWKMEGLASVDGDKAVSAIITATEVLG